MSDYLPLLERTEIVTRGEEAESIRVWYRVSSPADVERLFHQLEPGNWAVLVARVHSVRSLGGYITGAKPPGASEARDVENHPVAIGLEFRLDQGEIYLVPEAKTS